VPDDSSTTLVLLVFVDRILRTLRGLLTLAASTWWMVARIWRKAEVTEGHASVSSGRMVPGWSSCVL
jgi:hypothetical protein